MALVKAETAQGFQSLPLLRKIGLMVGLAATVALGVAVGLWSQQPNYTALYANLGSKDAEQVVDALQKTGIQFKVDESTGAVMVESAKRQFARMELAKDGMPGGSALAFKMLEKEQGFGTNQVIETARFQRALEGELGRTIATLRNVENARVHLAIPKRSVSLRDGSAPTASVMVDPYSGRSLDEEQIAAIVRLVSSSVPHLKPENVAVVDQTGRLLSGGALDKDMAQTSTQFAYNRKLEATYTERIRQLLEPIVGYGRVRASVNADINYTAAERSYGLDKTVSQTKTATGTVRSLSIAAVIDNKQVTNDKGDLVNKPWTNEELERFSILIKGAVGFNQTRGDTLNIINSSFVQPPAAEALPEPSLLEQPWFWDVAKQAVGVLGVLILVFGVLRPVMRSLAETGAQSMAHANVTVPATAAAGTHPGTGGDEDELSLSGRGAKHAQLEGSRAGYEQNLEAAKNVVREDPKRVAQLVKNWVGEDA